MWLLLLQDVARQLLRHTRALLQQPHVLPKYTERYLQQMLIYAKHEDSAVLCALGIDIRFCAANQLLEPAQLTAFAAAASRIILDTSKVGLWSDAGRCVMPEMLMHAAITLAAALRAYGPWMLWLWHCIS